MSPNPEATLDTATILNDIEKRVTEIFSAQKNEVEQSLVERIQREKEEAQKRIDAVNQEFAQVRGFLEEHKTIMAELQTTEEHLRGEIRGHFERAVNYQKMMENAAALAGGELERIGDLHQELEKVRGRAESEYEGLKRQLSGYAGIVAQIPVPAVRTEGEVDWTEEIGKLRRVRDLMATLRQAEPAGEDAEAEPGVPAAETAEEPAASLGPVGPEDDGVADDAALGDSDPLWTDASADSPAPAPEAAAELAPMPAPEAEPAQEPEAPVPPSAAPASVLNALERYRRTEPVNNGLELAFYAGEGDPVLDAGAFLAAVDKVVDGAGALHDQLTQTTSVKDLFLLKQEILNQQEVLRKVFFRIVRFCEKEGGRLPEALGEIVSSQGLKDIIERLTMANWSDPSDFKPFQSELKAMTRAFETRTAGSPTYLQSVLDEVEGRQN